MHDLRELKDAGDTGADDERRAEQELQKLTDARIAELDGRAEGQGRGDPRGLTASAPPRSAARYVAIITDGNGRWAAVRAACRSSTATEAGADIVKARLRDAAELGRRAS